MEEVKQKKKIVSRSRLRLKTFEEMLDYAQKYDWDIGIRMKGTFKLIFGKVFHINKTNHIVIVKTDYGIIGIDIGEIRSVAVYGNIENEDETGVFNE